MVKFQKKKRILSIFFSIRFLNPFFFELIIDSIQDSNKNLIIKNKTITLLNIYLNIFSTRKLNIETIEREVESKITNSNLIYSILKQRLLSLKTINKESKPSFEKNLFYNLYLNRYNELFTSQLLIANQRIQNLEMV